MSLRIKRDRKSYVRGAHESWRSPADLRDSKFELRFFEGFPRARIRLYPADETWSQCATHFAEEYGYFRRRQKNMYKAFACDAVVIDDGDEGLLRYCVSEVSEIDAREALEKYLKDQRWKAFSIRQIRTATPGEVAEYKLPVGGIKLML